MRRPALIPVLLGLLAAPAVADSVVAARLLRSQTVIAAEDVMLRDEAMPGALADPAAAIGKEVRVNIYAGRPVRAEDLAAPALVERNQIITLNYSSGGLNIATEARALDRAGPGERIRVMNLASRSTVTGIVMVDGTVNVAPAKN
ncbi:MAG: flagellar basal body P-ring formation protein FlgA [Mangrovicoccus sp.]|nr:flagellar basal body P-ring formation protein FlgA [Mangrovicoccus sp.]